MGRMSRVGVYVIRATILVAAVFGARWQGVQGADLMYGGTGLTRDHALIIRTKVLGLSFLELRYRGLNGGMEQMPEMGFPTLSGLTVMPAGAFDRLQLGCRWNAQAIEMTCQTPLMARPQMDAEWRGGHYDDQDGHVVWDVEWTGESNRIECCPCGQWLAGGLDQCEVVQAGGDGMFEVERGPVMGVFSRPPSKEMQVSARWTVSGHTCYGKGKCAAWASQDAWCQPGWAE